MKAKPVTEYQKEPGLIIENKTTDQAHVAMGFRGYGRFNPKYEALEILSVILGGGMSSRLFVEVRVKRGLAYRIRNGVSSYDETGDIITSAGLNNDNMMEGLKVVLAEHRKLTEELVPEEELKRVKDYIKGLFVISLEPSDAQAGFYGEQELLENKIETPEEKLAKVDAVSAEDILEVAKDVFRAEKLNLAMVGTFEKKKDEIKKILNSW
ncbi:MAG: insulinase family protein [Candidatus Paceibacterota bacterium]